MAGQEMPNHAEAEELAWLNRDKSNLARCYLALREENEKLREAARQNAITADQWKREAERLALTFSATERNMIGDFPVVVTELVRDCYGIMVNESQIAAWLRNAIARKAEEREKKAAQVPGAPCPRCGGTRVFMGDPCTCIPVEGQS